MQNHSGLEDTLLHLASRIVEDAWEELRRRPVVQHQRGVTPSCLPDLSFAEAQRRSQVGRALLKRLATIDWSALPHDLALTLRLVGFHANTWSREAEWYWIVVDPLGTGLFGMFLPTAYCGGGLLSTVHSELAAYAFTQAGDADRYLALVADYARLIDEFTERTVGQAARGIRMPRVQVQQARAMFSAYKSAARDLIGVMPQRLTMIPSTYLAREIDARIGSLVEPAFTRALDALSDAYFALAPEAVGLGQYAGGAEVYAQLVKLHTTLDFAPDQIHARGHERMAEIEASMRAIRDEFGFKGDRSAFAAHLARNPRWRASTVEELTEAFQRYLDRLTPHFNEYFSAAPKATCGVAPLPEELEESMTYGYYDAPRYDRAEGRYLFNAGNLVNQPLFILAALTYHELMPGHHLHLATQHESTSLHPFRKYSFVNSFNEGWAEYAATFAGEIGLYEQPEERYGRLIMDAFLTCRLVVDTGMNMFGWSLERARNYMRDHSGMREAEILTESVRYSCDIPGQALAYKLGDTHILALRERVRRALGNDFRLKEFHAAVLGSGALPMGELDWHVEHVIERLQGNRR